MTEIVPLAVTALIPLAIFPLIGILTIEETAGSYAHPLIFLFLGGFLLARAMECWGLHRRLAFTVMRISGTSPARIIASLMVATAFLSLWISNTATTMVMLPIAISVATSLSENAKVNANSQHGAIAPALMLGVAYAATIGGMGSLIGTPPNALFAAFMKETYGIAIGFAQWMTVGIPIVLLLLPLTWALLTKVVFVVSDEPIDLGPDILTQQQPMEPGERRVAVLMCTVACLWIFRPFIEHLLPTIDLSDAGIAIFGALLLFVVPSDLKKGQFLLRWEDAVTIRWDILILFGGGLALAKAIGESGLAFWIGDIAKANAEMLPPLLLIAVVSVIVVYLGELASNTAIAAVFLPIAGAVAVGIGADPISIALPITLAASLGFMLPVATPPNAIVFGSGAVTAQQMLRAGSVLDVLAIAIVVGLGAILVPMLFQ